MLIRLLQNLLIISVINIKFIDENNIHECKYYVAQIKKKRKKRKTFTNLHAFWNHF